MRITHALMSLLFAVALPAAAASQVMMIGDSCATAYVCFSPERLTIDAGDTVSFVYVADTMPTGPHNVVADDGSFRCALGCDGDGEGGNGTPVGWGQPFGFSRVLSTPGRIGIHDEVSGVRAEIIVRPKLAEFAIGPGITGAWFDPAQSGHGILVEVLPGNRFLAVWMTFSPTGAQAWFTGVGTYSGNVATIENVDQPRAGRWIPNFDASRIVHEPWGRLTFTFVDCNRGRVDFSSVAGYGEGSMELIRLTQPEGLPCQ